VSWEPVIGLEIHIHLKTRTKMFCRCEVAYLEPENTRTCPVCLAHPGSLPVPNAKAIEWTIKLGLALDCGIAERELAFLENDYGFDPPKWEPFPHAEELLTYERGTTQVRFHLEDSARGIELEILSPDGGVEHLQIEESIQDDARPWAEETERIIASYGRLLRQRGLEQEEPVSRG